MKILEAEPVNDKPTGGSALHKCLLLKQLEFLGPKRLEMLKTNTWQKQECDHKQARRFPKGTQVDGRLKYLQAVEDLEDL